MRIDIISDSRTLSLPSIIKPKPVDEDLIEAAVRNIRVDEIKVNICRIGMFELAYVKWFHLFYLIVLLG